MIHLSEDFLRRCLEIAGYDLTCSLETMIAGGPHRGHDRYGGVYAIDFVFLLSNLADPGLGWGSQVPREKLRATTLGDIAQNMLDFEFAHVNDGEIQWCRPRSLTAQEPTPENQRLRNILLSAEAHDPEKLRSLVAQDQH